MPEGIAEWGCMDNGKASCSRPPLLIAQYYKHHFTTATNISLANYLPHHQRGCTEVAALNSHQSALIFQAVMEGRAGGLRYSFEAHVPTPHLQHPKFSRGWHHSSHPQTHANPVPEHQSLHHTSSVAMLRQFEVLYWCQPWFHRPLLLPCPRCTNRPSLPTPLHPRKTHMECFHLFDVLKRIK